MDNLNFWPYTDIHELNLDWILEKVKALDAKLNDDIDTYVQEYIDEHFEDWTVNANYDPNTQTIVYTNGTGAQQTLGDVIRFAIDNVFVDIKDNIARTAINTISDAISDMAGDITDNTTHIGNLASLTTTDKTNLVSAINEIDAELSHISLYSVALTGTTNQYGAITIDNPANSTNVVLLTETCADPNTPGTTFDIIEIESRSAASITFRIRKVTDGTAVSSSTMSARLILAKFT